MLTQFSQINLIKQPDLFDEYADQFQLLPLHLIKLFGSCEMDKVFDTMEYAAYAYDVAHIIIDNLQFMLSGQAFGLNKFDLQDEVITRLRKFSTDKNVHVTLVIHPKKVDDDQDINISSIFGTAKAVQEADNIFVLQNRNKYRLIDVRKNRYDGSLGRQGLVFDKETKRFVELSREELVSIVKDEVSIDTIITQRKNTFTDEY